MSKRYYYYLSKDYYKRIIKYRIVITVGILGIFSLNIMALWLMVVGIEYLSEGYSFRGFAILSLVVPSLFILMYILVALLLPIKYIDDIFITDKGINMPFPYDRKTKENFINYNNIKKIVVYINHKNVYYSLIHIYLNKDINLWLPVGSKNIIGLSKVDPYQFIKAVRDSTENKIPIEFRSWNDLSRKT